MKKHFIITVSLLIWFIYGLFHLNGCQRRSNDKMDIDAITLDATPNVELSTQTTNGNSLVRLKYQWKTGSQYKSPREKIAAKVHFVDHAGMIQLQDDHLMDIPPSDWQPDQIYEYERIVYIPLIPKTTTLSILMGCYAVNDERKIIIGNFRSNTKQSTSKCLVAQLEVTPPTRPEDLPEARIEYGDGWYDLERDPVTNATWRWMSGRGICTLQNPGREAELYIRGWLPTAQIGKPSLIQIALEGTIIANYPEQANDFVVHEVISNDVFNSKESIKLELITDQTYIPNQKGIDSDERRLGMMSRVFYFN